MEMGKHNAQQDKNKEINENKRHLGDWPVLPTSKESDFLDHLSIFSATDGTEVVYPNILSTLQSTNFK